MLQIDRDQTLRFSLEDVIGQRIAVLGMSGSGKTNTAAVLIEEFLSTGLPLTIIDMEGEYFGLKETYPLLVAGRSEHAEVPLLVENAAALAEMSLRRGISVILDLSDYDQEEIQALLFAYFERLWALATVLKMPYEVVIEEAHEFIPQGQRTPLKTLLTRFALRGRKRGIGVILASQRSAKVEKDLLSQASILFLHQVVHPTDMSVYKDLIPLQAREVEQQVRELAPGEVFVIRGRLVARVRIRKRQTFHAGATPTLDEALPHLKAIDATLLEEFRAITTRAVKEGGSDEVSKLKKQVRDAEAVIQEQRRIIARQQEQIDLLSRLSVHVDGASMQLPVPSALAIERATVEHMHTPTQAFLETTTRSGEAARTVKVEDLPLPLNEAKFASLQRRLRQISQLEREVLRVLVEQGKPLTTPDLAAWLNRAESTIRNHPPQVLLKLGLVARSREKSGYVYHARLAEYLRREFPGGDIQHLQSRLIHP